MRASTSTCASFNSTMCRRSLTASGRMVFAPALVSRSSKLIGVRSPRVSKGNSHEMPSLTVGFLPSLSQFDKLRREFRPHAFVFMLEKDEGVFPFLILHPLHPFNQIVFIVSRPAQAQVSPTRSADDFRKRLFVSVRYDQRAIASTQ